MSSDNSKNKSKFGQLRKQVNKLSSEPVASNNVLVNVHESIQSESYTNIRNSFKIVYKKRTVTSPEVAIAMNRVTQAMEKWRAIEAEYGLEKAKSMANAEADRQQE